MSETNKFCVFCGVQDEDVILLTLSTLTKCRYILNCRKNHQLKFNDVVLPQSANGTDGYHRTCHNNFLALKKKYKDVIPIIQSDNEGPSGEQSVSATPESTSSTRATRNSARLTLESAICNSEENREKASDVTENRGEEAENPLEKAENQGEELKNREEKAQNEREEAENQGKEIKNRGEEAKNVGEEVQNQGERSKNGGEVSTTTSQKDDDDVEMQQSCFGNDPSTSAVAESYETDARKKDDACFICNKSRVTVNKKILPLMTSSDKGILDQLDKAAEYVGDEKTRLKINAYRDLPSFIYHKRCKSMITHKEYQKQREPQNSVNDWHVIRQFHKIAFEEICAFVEDNVIKKKLYYYVESLRKLYNDNITTQIRESNAELSYPDIQSYKFESKLMKKYSEDIEIRHLLKKKVVHPRNMVIPENLSTEPLDKIDLLQQAAITLRQEIFSMKKRELPHAINAAEIARGECTIPDSLQIFYETLLSGGSSRRRRSEKCKRLCSSFAQDVIFGVTNGQMKPAKHLQLGIVLKSLTNSRKMLDIMNRYGHSCSYNVIEEIETEATISSTAATQVCPEDIIKSPDLCTGLAFDNFDRFVDSLTGKDTLHDTVGIIYQNIVEIPAEDDNNNDGSLDSHNSITEVECFERRKRRRTCDPVTTELEEYSKRPRFNEPLLPLDTLRRFAVSNFDCSQIAGFNHLWTLSHVLDIPKTPMWTGFQSQLLVDESLMQKVSYMTTINASPTNKAVVIETMKQAMLVADECGQEFMQLTYDLAISKVALQIQSVERPRFNRLFIHFGTFHIDLAYYKGVGKFIENCGVTNIMIDSEILAGGSLSGFITGKHYNRCKRLHTLLSLVLQILHWRQFLSAFHIDVSESTEIHHALTEIPSSRLAINEVLENTRIQWLLGKYDEYVEDTMNGVHGCTAQYFMTYIKLIDRHFVLQASVRRRNYDMYLYILPFITNLFFAFNQQNYARWLTRYHDNLLQVSQTHPGLEEIMRENGIGVRRTPKPHSTQPIDLILEETVNLDAANSMTGISHMTNSIAARQRWCKSHSFRTTVITNVMQDLSLRGKQDVSADLHDNRIKKSRDQLKKLLAAIEENINPFDPSVPQKSLFNISSGEAVSEEICDSLLNVDVTGNKLREKFIEECSSDKDRFEKPIKRAKVLTFLDAQPKKKISVAGKLQEVKMQRDLFGRLLGVAVDQKLDLSEVFQFPLTPMPLSLCHVDGSIHKTDKSALMKSLESEIISCEPSNVSLVVIDGFFVLHTIKEVPVQYGKIASKCLNVFLNHNAKEIAVMFDSYFSPSIKDNEHLLRENIEDRQFRITGPEQKRCTDFTKDLKNINFKKALLEFFIEEWSKDDYASNFKSKTLYVNAERCYKFEVIEGKVVSTIIDELSCEEHEEADTKIVHHVCNANQGSNVVVRCSDTDILIIMLANMEHVKSETKVWMNVGVSNAQRYVDVTKLHSHLGPELCKSLPGFHALTGCDFNPSFFRKGKKKPLMILRNSKEYQVAFAKLGDSYGAIDDATFQKIEDFVCQMYGVTGVRNVNAARLTIFWKNFKVKNVNEKFMKSATHFDGSTIPPCTSELREQVLRARYIANIWCHAHQKMPTALCPTNCGWVEKSGKYTFMWFKGEQVPRFVEDIIIQPENSNDCTSDDIEIIEGNESNSDSDSESS